MVSLRERPLMPTYDAAAVALSAVIFSCHLVPGIGIGADARAGENVS